MTNSIHSIALDKLVGHPGNPNIMSSDKFGKLVRNIERTGRYEPLVVRPHPAKAGFFEIINGHHRSKALAKLGRERADCVVWDVDDAQDYPTCSTRHFVSCSNLESARTGAMLARPVKGREKSGAVARSDPGGVSQQQSRNGPD